MNAYRLQARVPPAAFGVAAAFLLLTNGTPALADCSVTSGGGSIANPGNGAVLTCVAAGGEQTTTIGSGTSGRSATVSIEEGATVDVADDAIDIVGATVTLSPNATIQSSGDNNSAVYSRDNNNTVVQSVTMGEHSRIATTGNSAWGVFSSSIQEDNSQTLTLSGDGAALTTQGDDAIAVLSSNSLGESAQVVSLSGNSAQILTTGNDAHAIAQPNTSNERKTQTITLSGDGSSITTQGDGADGVQIENNRAAGQQVILLSGNGANITVHGANATGVKIDGTTLGTLGTAQATITLQANTSIISSQSRAIYLRSSNATNPASTVDSAGLIQAATNSILLTNGDDSLILRNGSNLSSPAGADLGAGTDTLTLVGSGSEDEQFLNTETVEVNADAAGWALTGTSSFADVNVNTGRLALGSSVSVANNLVIHNGASLGGTGTLSNVTNNGTLAPGNSIGTQTISGNFVQAATGTLSIEVNGAGNHDLLDVTGSATLDGIVSFIRNGSAPIADGTVFRFIEADGGVVGNFSAVADSLLFVDFTVETVGNNVQATARRSSLMALAKRANETAVAAALDNLFSAGEGGGINEIINALGDRKSAQSLLSTQSNTAATTAVMGAGFAIANIARIAHLRAAPTRQLSGGSAGSQAPNLIANTKVAADNTGYRYWLQATGSFGQVESDSRSLGADYNSLGTAFGIESDPNKHNLMYGAFVGFSQTEVDVKDLQDSSRVQAYQVGLYGEKRLDHLWHINGSVSLGYLNFKTTRSTIVGAAQANFDGYGAHLFAELGFDAIRGSSVTLSPYVGLQGSMIRHEEYREDGAGALNLEVHAESTEHFSTQFGVRYAGEYQLDSLTVRPTLKLGLSHEFLDQSATVRSNFSGEPTAAFKSAGPRRNRNSAIIGLGLRVANISDSIELYTRYDGQLSPDGEDNVFAAGFKAIW